jgi:hypothetical protein
MEPIVIPVESGLIVVRTNGSTVLIGTAGGLLTSDGREATLFTPLAVIGAEHWLVAGSMHGGTRASFSRSRSWSLVRFGDGCRMAVDSTEIAMTVVAIFWTAVGFATGAAQIVSLWRTAHDW